MSTIIQPAEWLSVSMMASIAFITSIAILIKELKKRKSEDAKFTTKWLQLFSLLAMIFGTIYTIGHITKFLPIACIFTDPLRFALLSDQYAFIGFYQLARIYYCFSQNQVHSSNGYPNWLFVIMYAIGIALCLSGSIHPWFVTIWHMQCGLNHKGQYITKEAFIQHPLSAPLTNVSMGIYIIWDVCTLFLYLFKAYSFKKYKSEQTPVYKRIMSILTRILVLTAFYEFGMVLCNIVGILRDRFTDPDTVIMMRILYSFSFLLASVIGNYSMYLMQQHNDKEYNQFLRILYKLQIHYICCCCKTAIIQAVEENITTLVELNAIGNKKQNYGQNESTVNTRDISVKNSHEKMPDVSVMTVSS
eukprot:401924_1